MSFTEMARLLRDAAQREAFIVPCLEEFAARYPGDLKIGTLERTKREAIAFGEMHAFMLSLCPHEQQVRDFISMLQQPKEKTMLEGVKSKLSSGTIWGGVVAALAGGAGLLGYTVSEADQIALTNFATQATILASSVASIIGGVMAIVGRIRATKRLK